MIFSEDANARDIRSNAAVDDMMMKIRPTLGIRQARNEALLSNCSSCKRM